MIRLIAVLFFALIGTAQAQQLAGITPCAPKSLSVTTSSGNVALDTCGPTVIVYNISTQEAFYNLVTSAAGTATTSSYSLPGSTFVVLQIAQGTPTWLAGITATSTTTFRIVQGRAAP
jgi:hypothetical protein